MPQRQPDTLFAGRLFEVIRKTFTSPEGERRTREIVVHRGSVAIVPMVDPEHVCLIRNNRPAVGETLYELPAGTLEEGESPEVAARRELQEETGYQARRWTRLLHFYTSPGFLTERMHLYLAEDLTPGPQRLQAGEQIATEVLPWDDALALLADGKIVDAKTLVGLLYCQTTRRAGAYDS